MNITSPSLSWAGWMSGQANSEVSSRVYCQRRWNNVLVNMRLNYQALKGRPKMRRAKITYRE